MAQVNTTERLQKLRELMKENEMDVYVVPSEDEHYSEYIAACDRVRHYISGFTGSAGVAVITQDKAALATDGRYFNQAAQQLDSNWELLKQGIEDVPTWKEWAAKESEGGKTVGVDSRLIPAGEARKLREQIKKSGGAGLKGTTTNLVAKVWGSERPSRPVEPVKIQDVKFAGKSMQEKIEDLRKELDKQKSAGFVVSMLDEIAWLCNLRGSDIPFNPVFFSYAVITPSAALLYVDSKKLSDDVKKHLGDIVQVRPYQAIFGDLQIMRQEAEAEAKDKPADFIQRKFSVSNKASLALSEALGGDERVDEVRSPIGDAKAIKNDTELEGMRQCHIRDGAALSEYFAWLEDQLVNQKAKINEIEAADKLEEIRSKHENFVGLSFDTISSTGPNAAVIHYKPEHDTCATIDPKAVYLCDSGAQYLDGTTDTTRTLHFDEPTALERKAYTLVLKGTIALDRAVFPKGTTGLALDSLARQFLWEEGLDYRHGTGHGVGSFLNVHEGPVGVGTRVQYSEVPLSAGNVLSDEPGYYEDGSFGIRIENIIMAKEVKTTHGFGGKPWLGFEHVTMTPMCRKLIDPQLLSPQEVKWLNDYHTEVWDRTKGYFESKDEKTLQWLKRETAKIEA